MFDTFGSQLQQGLASIIRIGCADDPAAIDQSLSERTGGLQAYPTLLRQLANGKGAILVLHEHHDLSKGSFLFACITHTCANDPAEEW